MSPDEYFRLAVAAREHAAEYLAWAEQEPRNRDRYLGYAATRIADARWYLSRGERVLAETADAYRIAA